MTVTMIYLTKKQVEDLFMFFDSVGDKDNSTYCYKKLDEYDHMTKVVTGEFKIPIPASIMRDVSLTLNHHGF